jgi:protein SCO1/2
VFKGQHDRTILTIWMSAALLSGCTGGASKRAVRPGDLKGDVLVQPLAAPDFTLTTTDGQPYHFKRETDGAVALLFFGYTHCPDVCPVHMANLAAVLRRLPTAVSWSVKVVFVTVDPARDTPQQLRSFLDNFDRTFVGLRGSIDTVNRIQAAFHMPPAVFEKLPEGGYAVGHGAPVIAIVGDSARVFYPFGIRQEDWLQDLPKLVASIPRARGAD